MVFLKLTDKRPHIPIIFQIWLNSWSQKWNWMKSRLGVGWSGSLVLPRVGTEEAELNLFCCTRDITATWWLHVLTAFNFIRATVEHFCGLLFLKWSKAAEYKSNQIFGQIKQRDGLSSFLPFHIQTDFSTMFIYYVFIIIYLCIM